MKNHTRLLTSIISLLLIALFSSSIWAKASLAKIRIGQSAEKTRVVFEVKKSQSFDIFRLDNPPRVVIDLHKAKNDASFSEQKFLDSRLKKIRIKTHKKHTRVVLDLRKNFDYDYFILSKNKKGMERVVVDLYKEVVSKEEVKESYIVKKALEEEMAAMLLMAKKEEEKIQNAQNLALKKILAKRAEIDRRQKAKAEAKVLLQAKKDKQVEVKRLLAQKAETRRLQIAKKAEEKMLLAEKAEEKNRLLALQKEAKKLLAEKAEEQRVLLAEKAEKKRQLLKSAKAKKLLLAQKAEEKRLLIEKAEARRLLLAKQEEGKRLLIEKAKAKNLLLAQKTEEKRLQAAKEISSLAMAKKTATKHLLEQKIKERNLIAKKIVANKERTKRLLAEKKATETKLAKQIKEKRLLAKKVEEKRLKAEKAKAKRLVAQKAEEKRLKAEKVKAKRLLAKKAEEKRIKDKKAKAKKQLAKKAEEKRLRVKKAKTKRLMAKKAEEKRIKAKKVKAKKLFAKKAKEKRIRLAKAIKAKKAAKAKKKKETRLAAIKGQKDLVVAIDAGHGGKDTGAIGHNNTLEKVVVLQLAKKLKKYIDAQPGMRAVLTRDKDIFIPLDKRVQIAHKKNADIFLSIHADAFIDKSVRGGSVYVLSTNGASSVMAKVLAKSHNASLKNIKLKGRDSDVAFLLSDLARSANIRASHKLGSAVLGEMGLSVKLHKSSVQSAGFAVLKSINMPSLLIETAFVSNPREAKKLRSDNFQTKMAKSIVRGISKFAKRNANKARWGETLYVNYKVQYGDTLSQIADNYGITTKLLKKINNIKKSNQLYVGRKLKIPVSEKIIATL